MPHWAYTAAALLCAGPAWARAQSTAAPAGALRVPGPVYMARPDSLLRRGALLRAAVPYRYTNPRRRAAAVWGCGAPDPPRLERWDGRRWAVALDPIVRRCGASPAFIRAGATREDVYDLVVAPDSLLDRVGGVLPLALLPGRFRLVRDITDSAAVTSVPPLDWLRPRAERTSNPFELRAAPGGPP